MHGSARMDMQTLRERRKRQAGIGIDHHKQSCLFTSLGKMTGHLERNQAAEGIADKQIRTLGLNYFYCVDLKICHFFNTGTRLFQAVRTSCLHTVDRVWRLQMSNELEKFQDVSTHAVAQKYWRGLTTGS